MAKLYAELTSDKGGRVASKGGDNDLNIVIKLKNNIIAKMTVLESGNIYVSTYGDGEIVDDNDSKRTLKA